MSTVVDILEHGNPDSQAVALPLLAVLPADSPWSREPSVLAALRAKLESQPHPANYAALLDAASGFTALVEDPKFRDQMLAALSDPQPDVQRAAVRISLEHFLTNAETSARVAQEFAHLGSSARSILIEEVNDPQFMRRHLKVSGAAVSQDQAYYLGHNSYNKPPNFLAHPVVLNTVLASLEDRDENVRAAALDLLRKVKGIRRTAGFFVPRSTG